ncbi:MAG TPA: ABC-F family ATP-binding cassette domain-containing protein [Fastidiosipila sp.]|nr:ABC-F family ATP-binding cassette domain-containing protein [Fastidiosipila sp.]
MLQVNQLTISHRRDLRIIINELSFVLGRDDKIAIIGEEGNGKSSLIQVLAYPDDPPAYLEVQGTVHHAAPVGYLSQFISDEALGMSVYDYVTSDPRIDPTDWQKINDVAVLLRLSPDQLYQDRKIGTLSGGEKTKMQLCRMLLTDPAVLLLDEPSNDLDLETLYGLEQFIKEDKRPILFVSHDETLIRHAANGILHLEQIHRRKTPVWTLARVGLDEYLTTKRDEFERQSMLAAADHRAHQARMERYRRIEQRVEHEQETISRGNPAGGRLLKKKMHAVKSLEKRLDKEYENRTKKPNREEAVILFADPKIGHHEDKRILESRLTSLDVFDPATGKRQLAKDIELDIFGRDKICLIGRNGSGKTTLLKKIHEALLEKPDLHVSYMPQDYEEELPEHLTPVEFLAPSGRLEDRQRALDFMGSMKFEQREMQRLIADLSGGQKAKLFMLRFVLQGADVLVLDEPTRNFSPLSAPVVRQVLRAFNGAIISVSHDRVYLKEVATRVYELMPDGLVPVYDY